MGYNPSDWSLTKPLLAEALPEVSEDHLTYVFTIRDGVKWHDGKPLTAEDVLFTFKAAMSPLVDSAPIRAYLTALTGVDVVPGRKVRVRVSKPDGLQVNKLANTIGIIPKHMFDADGLLDGVSFEDIIGPKGKTDAKVRAFSEAFNKHSNSRAPIGTGPYKFEKWDTGKEIVLVRNDDYWG